jgi:aspartate/methionine/tyrosine aminotransferase
VYLTDARAVTKYHPTEAPDGSLQLSVAENQMLEDLLVPAIRKFTSSSSSEGTEGIFHSDQIYYQPTHGREGLRTSMAQYLHRILKLPQGKGLDLDGMVLGAGCNAVLENICFCLTEPGDAVLLPTPYYAAFEFDLVARAALKIVPVNTMKFQSGEKASDGKISQAMYYPNRASLDAAFTNALESGSKPKILLLSHPNNPLGVCYPPSVVKECIEWARENKIHLVSDEIYAGSVYNQVNEETGEDTFESALTLASSGSTSEIGLGLGPYIHFVYALSKDFALSGLRVGVAYSENEEIRMPLQKLNDLCQISSQTQLTVEEMLSSTSGDGQLWSTDVFLPENNQRISGRSSQLQAVLDECAIPFLRGDSGLFLWMDFSEFLPALADGESEGLAESQDSMDSRERRLYLELMKEFGLLFTPGRSMRNELPGFFRCVFTAASDHEFALGLERVKKFVSAKRA